MGDVRMPHLGESVTEGTVVRWLKKVGDAVERYEPVVEIMTDKVNAEIPSDFTGTLIEIVVQEQQSVPIGTVLARIDEQRVDRAPGAPAPGSDRGQVESADYRGGGQSLGTPRGAVHDVESQSASLSLRFSPAVLRLAEENRIDLSHIRGTGAGGRVTRKDVQAYIASGAQHAQGEAPRPVETAPSTAPISGHVQPARVDGPTRLPDWAQAEPIIGKQLPTAPGPDEEWVELTPMRRTIASRMTQSKHEIPHAWTIVEADVTNLVKFRERIKDDFRRKEGVNLTYMAFFIKAVAETLREFPILNSSWSGDKIVVHKHININMAVGTEQALSVPVIHDADRFSILGLAHKVHDIATRARAGKLTAEDVKLGTFTVNNTGFFGSVMSAPIINGNQAAILSMESIVKRPVVLQDDAIAIRSMVNLCLSLDHRILDGIICGRFLTAVKGRLEAYGEHTIL